MRAMEIDVSLETLAARAAAGDRAAFGALYTHYHDALYGFALRRLGRPEDAEDLVEQAFYKALRAIGDRDPNRPFNVWLFHLTRNLITDYYRTHKEWRAVEPEDRVEDSTEEQVLKSYLDARLETALENLTARQRWVIQMRFFEGDGVRRDRHTDGVPRRGDPSHANASPASAAQSPDRPGDRSGGERLIPMGRRGQVDQGAAGPARAAGA